MSAGSLDLDMYDCRYDALCTGGLFDVYDGIRAW
jgi:hypothetical protein